jgi:hypothetical protein
MTGKWPNGGIDHKDGTSLNNCWSNLRLASQSNNCRNSKKQARVSHKGVAKVRSGLYRARIFLGRSVHLGYFSTPKLAHAAYARAAKKHFGEYARVK